MANFRISDLTAIAQATVDPTTDVLEISDISVGAGGSRKVIPNALVNAVTAVQTNTPKIKGTGTTLTFEPNSASATGAISVNTAGDLNVSSTTAATSTTVAALVVGGGGGFGGDIRANTGFFNGDVRAAAANMIYFNGRGVLKSPDSATISVFQTNGTTPGNLVAGPVTFNALTDSGKTIAGATGAVTQNSITGQVQFAAAATSLVVTNSLVTANSLITFGVGVDINMKSVAYAATAGSFTITANSAPSGTTKVSYQITN